MTSWKGHTNEYISLQNTEDKLSKIIRYLKFLGLQSVANFMQICQSNNNNKR